MFGTRLRVGTDVFTGSFRTMRAIGLTGKSVHIVRTASIGAPS